MKLDIQTYKSDCWFFCEKSQADGWYYFQFVLLNRGVVIALGVGK